MCFCLRLGSVGSGFWLLQGPVRSAWWGSPNPVDSRNGRIPLELRRVPHVSVPVGVAPSRFGVYRPRDMLKLEFDMIRHENLFPVVGMVLM